MDQIEVYNIKDVVSSDKPTENDQMTVESPLSAVG